VSAVGSGADLVRWRPKAVAFVALFLVACRPDITDPTAVELRDMSGEWEYTATQLRATGAPGAGECAIEDVTLSIAPWRATGFFGRSEGGMMRCTGALEPLSTALASYPVRRGGMVLHHIAFDFGTADWRHQGFVDADSMWGTFVLRSGGADLTGRFIARKR